MKDPEKFYAARLAAEWVSRRRYPVNSPAWRSCVRQAREFARTLRILVPRAAGHPLAERIVLARQYGTAALAIPRPLTPEEIEDLRRGSRESAATTGESSPRRNSGERWTASSRW